LLTPRDIQRNFGINPAKSPSYISTNTFLFTEELKKCVSR
jgi:hypothetical protein